MERNDFYKALSKLPRRYSWRMDGKTIVSSHRSVDETLNPVTAVAHNRGLGIFANNKKDTLKAGTALGLPRSFTTQLYDATKSSSNRGNTQVVRGRILSGTMS